MVYTNSRGTKCRCLTSCTHWVIEGCLVYTMKIDGSVIIRVPNTVFLGSGGVSYKYLLIDDRLGVGKG